MKLLSTLLISCFFIVVIPTAQADAAAVPMRWVIKKSEADTYRSCQDMEIFWRHVLRCEGWDGTACHRASLTKPNHVYCYQWYFMSTINRKHVNCNRLAHYYGAGGRFPKLLGRPNWDCRTSSLIPS